ncbi:MAG: ABC transporter permease [Armatimonadetes bacterium]|nr:ABC transporter permease [Armatimonadota bacterium]MDI9585860.1 ABC transporter permease [Acidobacteriota bacterium]
MSPIEALRVALIAIRANKMRSILTMLGVIIGVGSVIAMLAIGRGASADVTERIASMGTNILIVWPGAAREGRLFGGAGRRDTLKLGDVQAIREDCPSVKEVAPQVSGDEQVKWRNRSAEAQIIAVPPEYETVNNHPAQRGRYFSEAENRGRQMVCLVGSTVVRNIFGRSDPIGEKLKIKNIPFEVIGVLTEKGGAGGFRDPDEIVVVPLTVGMNRLWGRNYVDRIFVTTETPAQLQPATDEINKLLRRRHRIREGREDDFNVRGQTEILQTFGETAKTFTMLLGGIAAMSLLVGGIGVMNIMLVSVTERTREIGIRKAVGARSHDIMMQFAIESVTLCLVGGILGIAVGVGGAMVIAKLAGWRTIVSPGSILLAFTFSLAVGVIFGAYPAHKASSLRPIEALRYE